MLNNCLLIFAVICVFGGCVICPNDPWALKADPNDPQCTGGAVGDMGPSGTAPYIDWVSPRVPIGVPTVEINGGRFDPVGLTVEIHSGNIVVPTQIASNSGGVLLISPMWPATAPTAGSATLIAKNNQGSSMPKVITLVLPGFGPANASPVTVNMTKPSWVQRGQVLGASQFFVFEPPGIQYLDYIGSNGLFGSNTTPVPAASFLAATGDLDGDNTTDFVTIDGSKTLGACRYTGTYTCGDTIAFNLVLTNGAAALATGSTTTNRSLIAVASQDSKLYRCFYLRSPPTAQLCAQVTGFADLAKAVLVQALLPSGQADLIVLNQAGRLAIWRSDVADTFTKCPDCIDSAVASRSFAAMAVADLNANSGADLVLVDGQGVVVLLNDGQGKLKAISTTVAQMPVAQAITLGDIDNDGKPDLVLTEATTGKVWVWLNQSDGSLGDGKLAGPVSALDVSSGKPIAVSPNALVALDGIGAADHKQRLITTDLAAKKLVSWQNATQP